MNNSLSTTVNLVSHRQVPPFSTYTKSVWLNLRELVGDRDLRIVCVPSAESREDEDAVGGSRAEVAASERKK